MWKRIKNSPEYTTSVAFPLSTRPVTLSGKKIRLLWHDCSWQIHAGYYTCSRYLPDAYK